VYILIKLLRTLILNALAVAFTNDAIKDIMGKFKYEQISNILFLSEKEVPSTLRIPVAREVSTLLRKKSLH